MLPALEVLLEYLPYMPLVTFAVSIIGLSVALVALTVAIINVRRKSGMNVKGRVCIRSSANAEDDYVSNIAIENCKDKAVIIFKIYLMVGRNYYVELESFSEPHILKAYESYVATYHPVEFYAAGLKSIDLNDLIKDSKAKKRIVLSTSHGRYIVKDWIEQWDPIIEQLQGGMTLGIHPVRYDNDLGHYGLNIKYVVKIINENGRSVSKPIRLIDLERPRFSEFRLTEKALSSKDNLEAFITSKIDEGIAKFTLVEVIDIEAIRSESIHSGYCFNREKLHYYNWFEHIVNWRVKSLLVKLTKVDATTYKKVGSTTIAAILTMLVGSFFI
ncbi:hypothetical protein [Pseudoalteromonas porphyrae]|uniref:Uncharacterized protein n=1 Tax=Pseudoalteromonas porphyrae TaxID=187330 RepID=A0A0N1MW57_9GAMM|nr:hypothetical protein [Pseudoalteromonas porphyrae]KPH64560.1 hypothetical protein ADS77_04585 [Pseudoalteromonas porphyrae]